MSNETQKGAATLQSEGLGAAPCYAVDKLKQGGGVVFYFFFFLFFLF